MSWHMSPRYGHGILVSGYSVLTAVNWPYCEFRMLKTWTCQDSPRLAWDTPPFLLIYSLPYPTRTICRRVRTYARSITWQPNEKWLTIFHEYGALSHAHFARAWVPLYYLWWSAAHTLHVQKLCYKVDCCNVGFNSAVQQTNLNRTGEGNPCICLFTKLPKEKCSPWANWEISIRQARPILFAQVVNRTQDWLHLTYSLFCSLVP